MVTPVLDQAELAHLGTFRHITAIPEWVLAAQIARNMRPEYDSHLYAGYSKISFRDAGHANSLVGGLKLNLNEKSTLDLAYNAYKAQGTDWKRKRRNSISTWPWACPRKCRRCASSWERA